MKIKLASLYIVVALIAFGSNCTTKAADAAEATPDNIIRPFGDSITFGVGFSPLAQGLVPTINSPGGGYRAWLAYFMAASWGLPEFKTAGLQFAASNSAQFATETAAHDGYPGWRNDQLAAIAVLEPYFGPASKTLVHAGTNDFLQGADAVTAAERLQNLLALLLATNPDTHLYVAKIIRLSSKFNGDYQAINAQIDQYNNTHLPIIVEILGNSGTIVDMNSALTDDQNDWIADGIHPSCQGYIKMACTWATAINGSELPNCSNAEFDNAIDAVCPGQHEESPTLP